MTRVDVTQTTGGDVKDPVEQRCESFLVRELVDDLVCLSHDHLKVTFVVQVGTQRKLHRGHEEASGDAFTGDVSDNESQLPILHFYKIIQIPVDNPCGIRLRSDVESWDARRMLRQQASLDFRR